MGYVLSAVLVAALQETPDRAELPQALETWYRVTRAKQPAGFVHETLRRSSRTRGFEYALEMEVDLKGHAEELAFAGALNDELTLTEYAADAVANGVPSTLTDLAPREEVHVLPNLTLYALRQNDTLSKPGRVTLRARDVDVILEVGETVRREYRGREVRVTPVTFLKPFPASSRETELRDAFVDRYGRILEASMAGGARILIVDSAEEAGVRPLRRQGRRDPLDKETAMRNAALERLRARRGDPPVKPPLPTADTLMSDFTAASKLVEAIAVHKAAGELDEARKTYLEAAVRLQGISVVASKIRPELLPDVRKVRDDAELAWPGATHVLLEASRLYVQVQELMDHLKVEAMEQTYKDLLALRDRIEVADRPERRAITDRAAEVGTLVVRCRTRRDLAQVRLDVRGVTIGEIETQEMIDFPLGPALGVPFVRRFAEADINGRIYRTGDTIQGTSLRVDRITPHSVRVSLREEAREVPLRR